jgi:hypothetical protein
VKEIDVDAILVDWDPLPIEVPQPHAGLGTENGTCLLLMNGYDRGM